jgi:hypothetical protein
MMTKHHLLGVFSVFREALLFKIWIPNRVEFRRIYCCAVLLVDTRPVLSRVAGSIEISKT